MKKNKMMRLASLLLVAVLLTTCIISGTFAKYVTRGSIADEARVAKFGVVVTGSGHLFAENYFNVDDGNGHDHNYEDGKNADEDDIARLTVESSDGAKLVAPGTNNFDSENPLAISITGTPEVDVRITIDVTNVQDVFLGAAKTLPDMTTSNAKFDNAEDYYPIVYTLSGDFFKYTTLDFDATGATVDTTAGTATGTLAQIKAVLDVISKGEDGKGFYVDANTDLADASKGGIGTLTLTWEWAYVTADAVAIQKAADVWDAADEIRNSGEYDDNAELQAWANGILDSAETKEAYIAQATENANCDKQDTLLGDLAAGIVTIDSDYCLNTSISIAITVTQVD